MTRSQHSGQLWAMGAAIGAAGFTVPWKMATAHGEASINTLILLTAAALFNTLLTLIQERGLPRPSRFGIWVALSLALFTLAGNLASAEAIRRISPALLTVMQRSEVILVALLAWFFLGEKIDKRFWVAVSVAGAGLLFLYDPFTSLEAQGERGSGLLYALASAICFAVMAVLTRRFIHQINPVAVNGLRLWISVGLWFVMHGFPTQVLQQIQPTQLGLVSLAAFCGPFASRLCLMNSARTLEARSTVLATLAAPPLTLILAFFVIGDLPSMREIWGGTLILVAVAIPALRYLK